MENRKNNAGDHRVRVTKMLIRKAFMDLLQKKPIQSISITELCSAAGINRGTFYSHYSNINDLLKKIETDMMLDFKNALNPLLQSESEPLTPAKITTGIFTCLKENADICTVTLGDYGDKDFVLRLIHLGYEVYQKTYPQFFAGATPRQLKYFYSYTSAGCIGLLRHWLDEDMITPPDEVAAMAEQFMMHGAAFSQTQKK
ncbi:TetR/AcrR family transcriptional regulator [Ruminococcus sp. OA3]|uniref:TetR/AcrR family transcriptional regulator n=1 Tax=Ruminococcus sp. OA3 TaxID=2914164 RepID=UPI001F0680CC|nr:TetR/AcrR family transcriptional regulator [Ruminococcus sp. OA3]MCH1984324.1 TetR/AcrR family transcriptional regulator [Ruminococcus sp. OA3]